MLDTLSNIKSRLGITGTDYDTFLTAQITQLSAVIEAYCRRKFLSAAWTQTFYRSDLRDPRVLELYHYPLITLTSVTIDDVVSDLATFRKHLPTGRIVLSEGGWILGDEVEVVYTAGYTTCPLPVLMVLDALVNERYSKKRAGVDLSFGSDVQRLSIPGAISIDFDYSLSNNERKSAYGSILGSHVNVLDDWRSERAVVGSGKIEYVAAFSV